MRPITITQALAAADVDSVALVQTLAGAGPLDFTGAAYVTAGLATFPQPQKVSLTSTGNLSAINFTIVGTDYRGVSVSEVRAGPNNNTVNSVNTYATVVSITASAVVATAVSAGNAAAGASAIVPLDQYISPFDVSLFVDITGTENVTIQYTGGDIWNTSNLDSLVWTNHSDLSAIAADAVGTLISPVSAVRQMVNSGTGSSSLRVVQAGIT